MRSERDLRRLLTLRAAPDENGARVVEAVLAKVNELGYLSDQRFAADYTRLRQENQKYGRKRVQQALLQKGVAAATVDEAVGKAYAEVDEVALARAFAERKRIKEPTCEKELARAMRRLTAAGFSARAVWAVLRSWGAEVEEIDVVASDE
jgi:regulatory protein